MIFMLGAINTFKVKKNKVLQKHNTNPKQAINGEPFFPKKLPKKNKTKNIVININRLDSNIFIYFNIIYWTENLKIIIILIYTQ
jgi:hypothetical protein